MPKRKRKQLEVPGTEPARFDDLDEAASDLALVRDEWMDAQKRMKEKELEVVAKLEKYEDKVTLPYKFEDANGKRRVLKTKVKKLLVSVKEDKGGGDDPDDDGPEITTE